jgi:protoheme ferro-lyase
METTRVSSYFRSEGYKDASGTLLSATFTRLNSAATDTSGLTATAATLNKLQYAATSHKIAFGTVTMVTGNVVVSMADNGITTCAFFLVSPQASCTTYATASTGSATVYMASGGANVTGAVAHWMAVND